MAQRIAATEPRGVGRPPIGPRRELRVPEWCEKEAERRASELGVHINDVYRQVIELGLADSGRK